MLEQFLNHIQRHALIAPGERPLLAVSGGLDSMVMLDLFLQAGLRPGVVHCNFQLRPGEADQEEELVRRSCEEQGIPFFVRRFDTASLASDAGTSIQVMARNLRYSFFEETRTSEGFDVIATAHHLDDSVETFLMNFVRGTGIEGLTGIPIRNGNIVRPLLFATRRQIQRYAQGRGLTWLEDSSNRKTDYRRNQLRHRVLPELTRMNPALAEGFETTVERLKATRALAELVIADFMTNHVRSTGNRTVISLEALREQREPALILHSCLKNHGFSYEQCTLITREHLPGKVFLSRAARAVVDRNELIVEPKGKVASVYETINGDAATVIAGDTMLSITKEAPQSISFPAPKNIAYLDFDKLVFPLVWRSWRPGDFFFPLGSGVKKKLSDFLIDNKVPLPDKERVTVLESAGSIVWVVGWRISESVKITLGTRQALRVEAGSTNPGSADKTHS